MSLPRLSKITKSQWVSVLKNSLIAGLVAFGVSLQLSGDVTKPALVTALIAAGVAVVKVVEKAFTPAV